jgi:zinc transport system substrate-binding protein
MKKMWMIFICLLVAGTVSCSKSDRKQGPHKLNAVVTLFPLYDFARQIGGDKVDVQLLLPPGLEPHSFEPKPEDMLNINRADLFIFTNRYMEPWAEKLLKGIDNGSVTAVDAGEGADFLPLAGEHDDHDHGSSPGANLRMDPHIWLSIPNAQQMVRNIAGAFAREDPANAPFYQANAESFSGRLAELDARFRGGLSGCRTKTFMHGGHYAFGYLANRYGLNYTSAYAASANAEPSPRVLVDLVRKMKQERVGTIFYEEIISPAMAEMIARETGAQLVKLHGLHTVGKAELDQGATYLSLMERNLENLRKGLGCR